MNLALHPNPEREAALNDACARFVGLYHEAPPPWVIRSLLAGRTLVVRTTPGSRGFFDSDRDSDWFNYQPAP